MTNLTLRSIDIPQIHRFGVGFEKMFDRVDQILNINAKQSASNYPPYNIIKASEDRYIIEVAVAGFNDGEINIIVENEQLIVEGKKKSENSDVIYVYHGISGRDFVRTFTLADHVEVIGAVQENGILSITLERKIPEEKKPKTISITHKK
jgi:molecular chaperone IbpA